MAGNTLFNSILIDKIRFNVPKDNVDDEILEHYKNIMLKYFPQNAFKITSDALLRKESVGAHYLVD